MTPATITEGVLGLTGRHTFNGITLNDPGADPFYLVRKIGGLHSRGDWQDNTQNATARMGEIAYPAQIRGKTVTYEGEIRASTMVGLREARRDLLAAFAPTTLGTVTVAPDPARGGVSHTYAARPLQVEIDDEQSAGADATHPYVRLFVIGMRQYDPRYYADDTQQALAVTAGTTTVLTNAGSAPTEPVFTLPGNAALDQVDIRNQTTNHKLLFTGLTGLVPSGQSFVVDFSTRSVYTSPAGNDLSGRMDPTLSDWWDEGVEGIPPGANNLWGGGTGTTTYDVHFAPASW